jgi:hypothetical protein
MTYILISILVSETQKIINAINQKLKGSSFEGMAGFILSIVIAFAASIIKVFVIDKTNLDLNNYQEVYAVFSQVWAGSQIYFLIITKQLGLSGKTEIQNKPDL